MVKIPMDADILPPSDDHLINSVINQNKEIGMAATLLMEISQDEHERARLRSRRMYETDMYSDMATAELRGELRGELKANRKNALAMMSKGMGTDIITEITGLTVDEILRLK
jgi:predicted transposase/invertase (TIGR01784 family)